jgi:hypothetical protein
MRRLFVLTLPCLAVVLLVASDLKACGDKLMLFGRGARYSQYQRTKKPLSIVLYKHPNLAKGSGVRDFEAALKRVGHNLRVAKDLSQLNEALKSDKVDYVVADPSDVPALRESVESAPSKPGLVSMGVPAKAKEAVYLLLVNDAVKARK